MDFSLFYFAATGAVRENRYRLLLQGARFADAHGFTAVWTPERHFHQFGGLFPNPAVTGAALAVATERVAIRAGGSGVSPLIGRSAVICTVLSRILVSVDRWSLVDG